MERIMRVVGGAIAVGLGLASLAPAAVNKIDGGDAGEGLTLDASQIVYAWNTNDNTTRVVQGVTFQTSVANISIVESNSSYSTGDPYPGQSSSNDDALRAVLTGGVYTDSSSGATINITGLANNTLYKVDFLAEETGGGTQSIAYNGGSIVDTQAMLANTAYNFTNNVTSTGSGTIQINLTSNARSLVGGLAVSTVVPEPTSLAMLSLGGLAVLRRRRAR
jgi:hypothetical protein